jgi:predicted O-methyltransferase YrrM
VPPANPKGYEWTEDWFTSNTGVWSHVLGPLKGRPGLRYLEVGVYEGRSLLWALENCLTHPTSSLTAIDVVLSDRLLSNVEKSGEAKRITLIKGSSGVELRKLALASFDIIYVDGSHTADDVLADAVLSWQLLKDGGLIIFDDYMWDGRPHAGGRVMAAALAPRAAIDAFIACYRYESEVVNTGYQIVLRKTVNPCVKAGIKDRCSPFGQYLYNWTEVRLLTRADPRRSQTLSTTERDLVESILKAGKLDDRTRADPAFEAFRARVSLDLGFSNH